MNKNEIPKIIIPKVGEDVTEMRVLPERFIKDKVEMQLLSLECSNYKKLLMSFIEEYPRINTYILHIPFTFVSIHTIYSSEKLRMEFVSFVVDCIKISQKYNKEINILFHMETPIKVFKYCGGFDWVKFLVELVQDTNVYFLAENSMFTLENKDLNGGPFYYLVKEIDDPHLRICYDICHSRVNKNLYEQYYDIAKDIGKYTKSIHFSYTANNDGYKDGKTHGRVHPNIETLKEDLKFLQEQGFDLNTTYLVTEINEDDYKKRPDLIKELEQLEEIQKGK